MQLNSWFKPWQFRDWRMKSSNIFLQDPHSFSFKGQLYDCQCGVMPHLSGLIQEHLVRKSIFSGPYNNNLCQGNAT